MEDRVNNSLEEYNTKSLPAIKGKGLKTRPLTAETKRTSVCWFSCSLNKSHKRPVISSLKLEKFKSLLLGSCFVNTFLQFATFKKFENVVFFDFDFDAPTGN